MLIQSKKPFTPSPSINCCCQAFIHTSVAPIGWAMLKYHKLVFCYTSHRHHFIFYKPPTICRMLREEGLRASRIRKHKFLQKHKQTNSIERRSGSGWPMKMTAAVESTCWVADEGRQWFICKLYFYPIILDGLFNAKSFWLFYSVRIILRCFYSVTNCSRTVRPFRLKGEGVSYNGKSCSVFILFH